MKIGKIIVLVSLCVLLSGCFTMKNEAKKVDREFTKSINCSESNYNIYHDFMISEDEKTIKEYHYNNSVVRYSDYEYESLLSSGKTRSEIRQENQNIADAKANELKANLSEDDYESFYVSADEKRAYIAIEYSDKYIDKFIKTYNINSVDDLINVVQNGTVDGITYTCEKRF